MTIEGERAEYERKRRADRGKLLTLDGKRAGRLRKATSAKVKNKQHSDYCTAACLVCGRKRIACVCAGAMSAAAQERFYASP